MQKSAPLTTIFLFLWFFLVSPAAADSHGNADAFLKAERVVLCKGVDQRTPLGISNVFAADIGKIYCFTKITGAGLDTVITHRWYLNGDLKSTVELPVKSKSWRTWSYKQIGAADVGDGMVEIVAEEGTVLATIIFFIQ